MPLEQLEVSQPNTDMQYIHIYWDLFSALTGDMIVTPNCKAFIYDAMTYFYDLLKVFFFLFFFFLPTESFVLSRDHVCVDESVDLLSKEQRDGGDGGRSERERAWNEDEGQQRHGKGEDEKKGGGAAEKRGATEGAARRQGGPGSAEDAGGPKRPEAAREDRGEGEGTHGAETQTTTDVTAEENGTQPAVDLLDAEPPPPAACEPSGRSQSLLQSVGEEEEEEEEDAPSFAMEGHETPSGLRRGVDDEPHCVAQEAQSLRHDAVQTFAESASPSPIHHALEKPTEEEPFMESAANMSTELSGSRDPAPSAAKSDGAGLQELATAQTPPGEMKRMDASPPCPEINDDSSAYGEREDLANSDTHGNDALETQTPTAECTLEEADAADLETGSGREAATANRIDGAGDAKVTKKDADSKPPVLPSHESDATPETGDTKCFERSPAKETLHGDTTCRSSFDWRAPRERTGSSRDTANASVPRQFVQVTRFKHARH